MRPVGPGSHLVTEGEDGQEQEIAAPPDLHRQTRPLEDRSNTDALGLYEASPAKSSGLLSPNKPENSGHDLSGSVVRGAGELEGLEQGEAPANKSQTTVDVASTSAEICEIDRRLNQLQDFLKQAKEQSLHAQSRG